MLLSTSASTRTYRWVGESVSREEGESHLATLERLLVSITTEDFPSITVPEFTAHFRARAPLMDSVGCSGRFELWQLQSRPGDTHPIKNKETHFPNSHIEKPNLKCMNKRGNTHYNVGKTVWASLRALRP